MIRKIVTGLFLIYLSLWLAGAYLIEREILKFSNHGLEFQKITISGFPGSWHFNLHSPKLTVQSSDEIQTLGSKAIALTVSLSFKNAKFKLDHPLFLTTKSSVKTKSFKIEIDPLTKVTFKFLRPVILAQNDSLDNIRSFKWESENIYVSSKEEELAFLEATSINLKRAKQNSSNSLDAIIEINYAGRNEIFGFDSMRFIYDGNINYNVEPDNQKIMLNKIDIETLELEINENTYLGLFGSVVLSKYDVPKGKFELELQNYPEMIDLLWTHGFNITAKEAKDIINDAVDGQDAAELTIPLIFSESGIIINGKNLKDLKGVE